MTHDAGPSRSSFRVRYHETDQMGVVHHGAYVNWLEIGRTDYIRELGLSYAELEKSGLFLAVTEIGIRYHDAARYDERVRVDSWIEAVRSRSVVFGYEVLREDPPTRLATARTTLVALDAAGAPRRLPAGLLERFRAAAGA